MAVRLFNRKPEMQNIPIRTAEGQRIRDAITPKITIDMDFSEIEKRVFQYVKEITPNGTNSI